MIPPLDCDGVMCADCAPYGCSFPDKEAEPSEGDAVKFRTKPVVIEAAHWTGSNVDEVLGTFVACADFKRRDCPGPDGGRIVGGALIVRTAKGEITAKPDDWIIKAENGEFHLCKPDAFGAMYEPVA